MHFCSPALKAGFDLGYGFGVFGGEVDVLGDVGAEVEQVVGILRGIDPFPVADAGGMVVFAFPEHFGSGGGCVIAEGGPPVVAV